MNEEQTKNSSLPTYLNTDSPHKEIKHLASVLKIDPKFIDFKILKVTTSYTNEENKEPVEVSSEEKDIFDKDDFYLDPSLNIEQNYEIECFDSRDTKSVKLPNISISANVSLTKVVAKIHACNDVKYQSDFDILMYNQILKNLVKAGILIKIREGELKKELKRIASILRIKEVIDKDYTITVTYGCAPIKSINSNTIFHYKNKINNVDENDKVDHASRGFLQGVVPHEVIIEYIKPKDGKNGRNVRGELIEIPEPDKDELKDIIISDNIKKVEDDETIKFISKKAGFVSEEKGTYDIKDQLEIKEINFKQTGSIKTSFESNVSLVIKENDIFKDAIGTGVNVEAKEVSVKGSVGANATVKAEDVIIGGQTHAKTKIYATNADIAIHIGEVEAKEVRIDRLEGGKVIAKKAIVKSVVGGSIIAEEIIIDTLGSNSTLTALNLIDVKYLKGTNNKFIIDTGKMKDKREDIENQIEKIDLLSEEVAKLPKEIESKKVVIDENKNSIYTIKEKVEEIQRSKMSPPVTFMKKLKEYQQLVNDYNLILKEYKEKSILLAKYKKELLQMQDSIFAAKIINRSNWLELNEIKFILIDPPKEINYITKQNEMARIISLEKVVVDDEDDYQIKKVNDLAILQNLKD